VLLANDPTAPVPPRVDAHHSDDIACLRADRTWDRRERTVGSGSIRDGATVGTTHIQKPS